MTPTKSIWYRLGYALERARQAPPAAGRSLKSLAERTTERKPTKRSKDAGPTSWPSSDDLIAAGVTAAVAKILDGWSPRGKTGFAQLLKAGASGAAAALAVDVLAPLLRGEAAIGRVDEDTGDRMLAGAGQGLLYGAIVEPRVPGPALVKGALYGSAEYAVDPVGGLSGLLGKHAPQRKLPIVGNLLESLDAHDRAYVEHVAFGIALAVLYGSSRSSNGIRIEVEDE